MSQPAVVVVGASNLDLISYVPRLPEPGETLHGTAFQLGYGGKGANQAVMAAKLGSPVTMVAKVGTDVFGDDMLENFGHQGVDTAHIHRSDTAFSGVAPISVTPDGTNAITIVNGANDELTEAEIERARPAIAAAGVLVCQLEIPLHLSLTALRIARDVGTRTILNPAPARADLPDEFYRLADICCPNEPETQLLTGMPMTTTEDATARAHELRERGAGAVVLTLGARGCLVVDAAGATEVAAPKSPHRRSPRSTRPAPATRSSADSHTFSFAAPQCATRLAAPATWPASA